MTGAIGNVSSEPKLIDVGMIGTIATPIRIKFAPTTYFYSDGIVYSANSTITVVITHTSRVANRNLFVFFSTILVMILAITPTHAVMPPYIEIIQVGYTTFVGVL